MSFLQNAIGLDEVLPVTNHHDVYPAIDPSAAFKDKLYKGRVVLVTGASAGIGAAIALFYAKAGASVAIVARRQQALDERKAHILKEAPDARILSVVADVKDWKLAERAVKVAVAEFGRLDILIANAGVMSSWTYSLTEKNPDVWWNTWEVNVRGVFNSVRAAVPELQKTQGYAVVISAGLAQIRVPGPSDYNISKFAVGRLVEYINLEFPTVKSLAFHPGVIRTDLLGSTVAEESEQGKGSYKAPSHEGFSFDTPDLPAAALLYLTSGRADWLSGRYYSTNWDITEVERDWKIKIVEQNGLVSKLYIPK